jgi:hypothetical protein
MARTRNMSRLPRTQRGSKRRRINCRLSKTVWLRIQKLLALIMVQNKRLLAVLARRKMLRC